MKIGIDISQTVHGGGVAFYTQSLVETLLRVDQKNNYSLFFSSLRRKPPEMKNLKSFKIPPTLLDILWNRLHVFPIENFMGNIDVFHASDWTQPPTKKAKIVTTIHDLSFLRWPDSVHPKVLSVQQRRLKWVKKEADAIIAVSQATKKEIINLLKIPEKKITVICEALSTDLDKEVKEINSEFKKKVKRKFGINKPYIYAYGSQAPRKNIDRLIRAFKNIKEAFDYQLVIVGGYQLKKDMVDIISTGYLPRKEMIALLSEAEVFAYPSLYEGFGLPILEAFFLKIPVVTSNVSSMPEVAGDAAVLVDPQSVDSITQGIRKVLRGGKDIDKLIKRGKERLKLFSWEKTAQETIKVYERVTKL